MTVGWKPETLSEIAGQDEIRIGSGRMGGGCNQAKKEYQPLPYAGTRTW
jgi:hypothetical protein